VSWVWSTTGSPAHAVSRPMGVSWRRSVRPSPRRRTGRRGRWVGCVGAWSGLWREDQRAADQKRMSRWPGEVSATLVMVRAPNWPVKSAPIRGNRRSRRSRCGWWTASGGGPPRRPPTGHRPAGRPRRRSRSARPRRPRAHGHRTVGRSLTAAARRVRSGPRGHLPVPPPWQATVMALFTLSQALPGFRTVVGGLSGRVGRGAGAAVLVGGRRGAVGSRGGDRQMTVTPCAYGPLLP
jgi:hypothetical protein